MCADGRRTRGARSAPRPGPAPLVRTLSYLIGTLRVDGPARRVCTAAHAFGGRVRPNRTHGGRTGRRPRARPGAERSRHGRRRQVSVSPTGCPSTCRWPGAGIAPARPRLARAERSDQRHRAVPPSPAQHGALVAAAHTGASLVRWHKKRNSFIDELSTEYDAVPGRLDLTAGDATRCTSDRGRAGAARPISCRVAQGVPLFLPLCVEPPRRRPPGTWAGWPGAE
jgi:hypothetical protein